MGYYAAMKRKASLMFATTQMDLENMMLSETARHQRSNTEDSTYTRPLEQSNS